MKKQFQTRLGDSFDASQFTGPAALGDERRCLQIGEIRMSREDVEDLIGNLRTWAHSIDSTPKRSEPRTAGDYLARVRDAVRAVAKEMADDYPEEAKTALDLFVDGVGRFLVRFDVPRIVRDVVAKKLDDLIP